MPIMREELQRKLKEMLIEQLGVASEEIKLDSNLMEDLGADSLDITEFVMKIEDEYGISIPDEELSDLTVMDSGKSNVTFGKIVDYVFEKISAKG